MSASDPRKHSEHHFLGHIPHHSRKSLDAQHEYPDDTSSIDVPLAPVPEPRLPDLDLPHSELDLTTTFESILSESIKSESVVVPAAKPEVERVQKRASNVLKLSQENEKLKEELRAMNERLEAAEKKQQELKQRAGANS